jgi:hypothetical protein
MSSKQVKIPLVYVAGPYRAPTTEGVVRNIGRARQAGMDLVTVAGVYPVIPHCNTAAFDGLADDQFFLDATLELLRRCDGVLLLDNWATSAGARGEKAEAERLGIPVFHCVEEVRGWNILFFERKVTP